MWPAPAWAQHHHAEFAVHGRARSQRRALHGFGQTHSDTICCYSFGRVSSLPQRASVLHLFIPLSSRPLAATYPFNTSQCLSRLSCQCNHMACSLQTSFYPCLPMSRVPGGPTLHVPTNTLGILAPAVFSWSELHLLVRFPPFAPLHFFPRWGPSHLRLESVFLLKHTVIPPLLWLPSQGRGCVHTCITANVGSALSWTSGPV